VLIDMAVPFNKVETLMLKVVELAKPSVPNLLLDPKPSVVITEFKDAQAVYRLSFYVEVGERSEGKTCSTIHKLLQRGFPIVGIEVGWARSETRNHDTADELRNSMQPAIG